MSITNLLTQWRSNAEKYSAEARRVFKRIKRVVEADKPSGPKLDDLVDEIGKTFTTLLIYCFTVLLFYCFYYYYFFRRFPQLSRRRIGQVCGKTGRFSCKP